MRNFFKSAAKSSTRARSSNLRTACEALEVRQLLSVAVTTYHNDVARTGLNSNEVLLTPSNVKSATFGKKFAYSVQGQVYAQPLYVPNVAITGQGVHDVVIVVTQNNDVYAFDAESNSGANAGLLWHVNLGLAAATPNNFFGNRYGPYHDINPQVGITSTPVIDSATGTIYIDAFTQDSPGQNVYSHHIHALDLANGTDKVTPMLVAATVKGNGVGGNGTTIPFVASRELQRPALTLLSGTLYVGYSGYADTDPYHGWLLGFNASSLQLTKVLNLTPNADTDANEGEGGIWQTGNGLASDGTNLFVETANGDFNPAVGDYSDSFLRIGPDSSTAAAPHLTGYGLNVNDYFTPYNEQSLADADEDLGSGGSVLLPDQPGAHPHEVIGGGKQGILYVVDRDNMGHHNSAATGNDNNVVQKVNVGHGFFDSPAYFNSAIYVHAVGDVLKKYTLNNGLLSAAPAAQTSTAYSDQGATPSISSNGNANGIVWDEQWNATHLVLHAYDAGTLTELYNSNQNSARDQLGSGVKFAVPTVADGKVFVGSGNALTVFGLISPPTTAPAVPSNLTAAAASPSSVNLSWVDNASNESGFKIERSTDDSTWTQVGLASADSTSYLDSGLSASTLYYYRIRATNVIGDSAYTPTPDARATTLSATGAIYIYHFDAGSGTSAVDSVSGNNGTLTGTPRPTWVSGKIGPGALAFSGGGTYEQTPAKSAVTVTNNLAPVLGSTSTLTAWIKTTQTGNDTHWMAPAITGVEEGGGTNDINWGTFNASGHIGIYVADDGGVYSTNAINDNQWHNVAITRNATTGLVQLYIDGVLNGSATYETGNLTSRFFLLGALSDVNADGTTFAGANYFNGQLDEVRIYNQALSSGEIAGIAKLPGSPTLVSATVASGPVVHLTWTTPSSYTQNIEVDRKVGASGTYVAIATVGGGETTYDDDAVTPGTQYTYVLKAIDLAGTSAASNSISVTPPAPTIVANSLFYNNSAWDGNNGSSNQTDTTAVATDKQALLPGGAATFKNVSNYSKGINGIIIDVANLDSLPRFEDYSFYVGNNNNPASWSVAPSPTYINVYPGRGPGGSTQITIIWDDNAIQNQWLQVGLLANAHTNLTADDIFYYGNAIGETGDSSTDFAVTTTDEIAARNHKSGLATAPIDDIYDFDRDKHVDTTDELIARNHKSGLTPLAMIHPPLNLKQAASKASSPPPAKKSSITPVVVTPVVVTPVASSPPAAPTVPAKKKTIPIAAAKVTAAVASAKKLSSKVTTRRAIPAPTLTGAAAPNVSLAGKSSLAGPPDSVLDGEWE